MQKYSEVLIEIKKKLLGYVFISIWIFSFNTKNDYFYKLIIVIIISVISCNSTIINFRNFKIV